jgi:Leucine-rich repeat (LRR) protein
MIKIVNYYFIIAENEELYKDTLDLSRENLKKIPKIEDAQSIRNLILDENELQKIDSIDAYLKIEKVGHRLKINRISLR